MTWIKTVPLSEASKQLIDAMEQQRQLYPAEYAQPVHPSPDGPSQIVASHSLIPEALRITFYLPPTPGICWSAIALLPPCSKISPETFTRWPANFISLAFCPCAGTAVSMSSRTVLSSARITSGEPARAQLLAQATLFGC